MDRRIEQNEFGEDVEVIDTGSAVIRQLIAPGNPNQRRRAEIAEQLDDIDRRGARAVREIVAALAEAKPVPAFAKNKVKTLEADAEALRSELAGLPE